VSPCKDTTTHDRLRKYRPTTVETGSRGELGLYICAHDHYTAWVSGASLGGGTACIAGMSLWGSTGAFRRSIRLFVAELRFPFVLLNLAVVAPTINDS
jgi:hypothetical protein